MKKILLCASALLLAVACSKPVNNELPPVPPTPPTPESEPTINRTEIKDIKAVVDTVHLIIGNYTGEISIEPEDTNFAIGTDNETIPGTIILRCYTLGSTNIKVVCGSKTFTIPASFDKAITDKMYNETLLSFGKTVEEVKKLETDRGSTFIEEVVVKSNLFVKFKPAVPVAVAEGGEELIYVFAQISEGQYGPCKQTSVYAYYGTTENDEAYAEMAWITTTENNYYAGENPSKLSMALTRDISTLIYYQNGKSDDGKWSFIAHYMKFTPSSSAPQAIVEIPLAMTKPTTDNPLKLLK